MTGSGVTGKTSESPPTVRTVGRALDILFCLAEIGTPAPLAEISRCCGLDKATTYRLVRAMHAHDLVRTAEQPGHYVLGLGVLRLSSAVFGGVDIRSVARPFMRDLRDFCGETVALSILLDDRRVYIDQIESQQQIRWLVRIGESVALYAGSASKVILAFLPENEREGILARTEFVPITPSTPRSVDDLRPQLEEIRRTGVAVAFAERDLGVAAIAAPILDYTERSVGALTICGPDQRFDMAKIDRCREPLLSAAQRISSQLGYRGNHAGLVAGANASSERDGAPQPTSSLVQG